MKTPYLTTFSKALLTGLFAGIGATIICLAYNVAFRDVTHFQLSDLINVSSLIFFVNLVFLIIGIIYYGFLKLFKKGNLVFMVVFILLTIFFTWKANLVHRSDDPLLNVEFHHFLMAIVIIMGLIATFGIPALFHSKKFEEHVL